jgi:hypothetical protein
VVETTKKRNLDVGMLCCGRLEATNSVEHSGLTAVLHDTTCQIDRIFLPGRKNGYAGPLHKGGLKMGGRDSFKSA